VELLHAKQDFLKVAYLPYTDAARGTYEPLELLLSLIITASTVMMSESLNRGKDQKQNSKDRKFKIATSDEITKELESDKNLPKSALPSGTYSHDSKRGQDPEDDIDLSSEEKGYISGVKTIKAMNSPSSLGSVRLPTAAVNRHFPLIEIENCP
jgi:hypothetical protein